MRSQPRKGWEIDAHHHGSRANPIQVKQQKALTSFVPMAPQLQRRLILADIRPPGEAYYRL